MSVLSLALNLLPSLVLNPHAFFLLKYHYMIRSAEEGRLSQCCTSTLRYSTYRASFAFLLSTLSSYIEYLTKQRRRTPYQRSALHTVRHTAMCFTDPSTAGDTYPSQSRRRIPFFGRRRKRTAPATTTTQPASSSIPLASPPSPVPVPRVNVTPVKTTTTSSTSRTRSGGGGEGGSYSGYGGIGSYGDGGGGYEGDGGNGGGNGGNGGGAGGSAGGAGGKCTIHKPARL
ncbi:hypothetical protein M432DRAFT_617882 [Thermoascus aurantiacus ATCC 26904]